MKTKQITHEHELLADSFDEAMKAAKKCYEENPGFQFGSISKEYDYHSVPPGYTGRFEVKLRFSTNG